jgi:glycosyltransferase involved in cell wall biosynthesis
MKVGVMMRSMDQDSGFRTITEGTVEHMIKLGVDDAFLLMYRTDKWLGRFASYPNVKEVLLKAPHLLLWDQVAVPWCAWREKADVVFNPKFSIPLISPCPAVMGLQEPAWWVWPEFYEWLDRRYMRFMLPLYIRKARWLFPISQFVVDETKKYLPVPFEHKTTLAYAAPRPYFQPVTDKAALEAFRRKHGLPERFMATVTRVLHFLDGSDSYFPGKYPHATVRAFTLVRDRIPHHLVVVGKRVRDFLIHTGFTESDFERVHFLDFVPHEELPLLHSLSELFVIPSPYESFAMALVEAMACGCPVLVSQEGALPEITAGAGMLIDHRALEDIAEKMVAILSDEPERRRLGERSRARAAFFTWERTATGILDSCRRVVESRTIEQTNDSIPRGLATRERPRHP